MRYWVLFLLLGCLSCAGVAPQPEQPVDLISHEDPHSVLALRPGDAMLKNSNKSQNVYGNSYQIHFGPQRVSIKTTYRETTDQNIVGDGVANELNRHGYFDVRATSALSGTSLVGDGEVAYRTLNSSGDDLRPAMFRFGLTDRWNSLVYGASYKSVAQGFVPAAGPMTDRSREEAMIWGEHGVGPFRLRGSVSESWERLNDAVDLRVTRMAAAALRINRPRWGGSLSTSYGLVDQGAGPDQESGVLINSFTTSFRPIDFLLLEPNFSITDELNHGSGMRTQTPSSAFALTYSSPGNPVRLSGVTSFSRSVNQDGSYDVRTHGASAGVDWKIDNIWGRDNTLSFTINYNRQLDHAFRNNSHRDVSSMLRFKIAGF
jgi:hypothetical protein